MQSDWSAQADPAPMPSPQDTVPPRRRYGRVRQNSLFCNFGEVIDICADGMRIRGPRKLAKNRPHEIRLKGFTLPGPLWGVVVWSKRLGFFKHEMGLKFENTAAEVIQRLTTVAGCGGIRRFTSAHARPHTA